MEIGFETLYMVFPYTICAIIAGAVFASVIGRYIEGAISVTECTLIAGTFIGFVLAVITMKFALAGGLLAGLILLLVLPVIQGKRACHKFDIEQLEKFRAAIESDPRNLAAHEKLAETYARMGDLDAAITEYGELLRIAPGDTLQANRLQKLIELRDRRKSPPLICPHCGASNPAENLRCYNCEGHLTVSGSLRRWLVHGGLRQLCITWAIAMAVITLVVVVLASLPIVLRVFIGLLAAAVVLATGIVVIWRRP